MRDRGVRAIALYKTVKGALQLAAALALAVAGRSIDEALLHALHHHAASAMSRHVAALLAPSHVRIAALALLVDGVFTSVEGWALRRGHAWGRWLVVVSTSTLVPFEIAALVRHAHAIDAIALVVNVAIVAYLASRARREQVA